MKLPHLFFLSLALPLFMFAAPAEQKFNLGMTLRTGNADSSSVVAGYEFLKENKVNPFRIQAEYRYADSDGSVTDARGDIRLDARQNFDERWYASLLTEWLRDDVANINSRTQIGPSLGMTFVKSPAATYTAEVGITYIYQDMDQDSSTYDAERWNLRLSHMLKWNISENALFFHELELLPRLDGDVDLIANAETGLETSITKTLALQVKWTYNYNETPALDDDGTPLEKSDNRVDVSLVVKF